MNKCHQCGKEMEVLRKTKRYCSVTCRTVAHHLKSLPVNAIYQDAITIEEAVEILNWYWWNERDTMQSWTAIEFLDALFIKTGHSVYRIEDGSYKIL